ncbi:MAG: hypothetical protein CSA22_07490 [Deltaproteobacteria bacterium]|nr:MAG: hypothetical protein CSA22_07490 [Deltaproteobacteria bacterium]
MSEENWMRVNVNLDVTPDILQAIVRCSKAIQGPGMRGKMDTADVLSMMVSKFLYEHDFQSYVSDTVNYPDIMTPLES